jgi:hypothetical protein
MNVLPTTLSVAVILCAGCVTEASRQREALARRDWEMRERAATMAVDSTDGISEVEALAIGIARYRTYRTACGSTSLPLDDGANWKVITYFGVAGLPYEEVIVRKSDGLTSVNQLMHPTKAPEMPSQPTDTTVAHPDFAENRVELGVATTGEVAGHYGNVDIEATSFVSLQKNGAFTMRLRAGSAKTRMEYVASGSWRLEEKGMVIADVTSSAGEHRTVFLRVLRVQGYSLVLQLVERREDPTSTRLGDIPVRTLFFRAD